MCERVLPVWFVQSFGVLCEHVPVCRSSSASVCSDEIIWLNLGMASGALTVQGEMLFVVVLKRPGNALRQ